MTAVDERGLPTRRQGGARSARGQRTVRPTTSVPATTEAAPPAAPVEPPPVSGPAAPAAPPGVEAVAAPVPGYPAGVAEGLFADALGPAVEPVDTPVEVPSEPVEVPSEPVEVPSEPVEVPSEPVEVPSEPVEVPVDVQRVPVALAEQPPAPVAEEQPGAPMPSPVGYGRLVTVYSPKGGTGATFFATNLAVALADGGRSRVCLVDLDLQFGDVAIVTSVTPSRGIVDAVDLDLTEDPAALGRLITPVLDGLDSLLAPVDPAAGDAVTPGLVADLLAALRGRYDYVVVDTSTYLSEITLEALDAADHQVLLTTPDLPSIKSMRLFLDTLDLLGADPARRALVLNRLDQRGGLQAGDASEALRHPLAAVVPADAGVGESIDAGRPLLAARRAGTVSAVLRTFAEHHLGAAPQAAAARKRRLRRGRKNAS